MDRAEVFSNLGDHVRYLLFIGDVAQISASFDTFGLAGCYRVVEFFLVQVDQGQLRAFAREILGHRAA
ncbi:hypothetical protein D3C81_2171050 [compost metagenome]